MLAVAFLAAVIGWRIGRGGSADPGRADVGFLFDMTSHHEQAINMATIELLNGEIRDVKVFADEILRFQSYEIGLMEGHLARLGYTRYEVPDRAMTWMDHTVARDAMPGLASEEEMDGLRGGNVDAWFITLMVDHHAGGAAMADEAVARARDDQVRELAARMARVQRSEIAELLAAADRAGLQVPIRGATWDVYESTSGAHGNG